MRSVPLFCVIALLSSLCAAQPATQPSRPQAPITLAVLDFDANLAGNPDLGKQSAEAITALLGGQSSFRMVDRAQLTKALNEHELNMTGLVDQDKAVKAGQIVGARLIVTGKIFAMDKTIIATAKIIGTETTLVEAVMVKAKIGSDTGELVAQLAQKLQEQLNESASRLLPTSEQKPDPLAAVKEKLQNKTKPVIMIQVAEQHVGEAPRAQDPPVETELRSLLLACGFTVADQGETTPAKAKAELLIKGEGFSEFAARIQSLRSCTARVELSLVNVSDGKVVATTRTTARAADLSENIAGKTALQTAGNQAGIELLQKLAESLPNVK